MRHVANQLNKAKAGHAGELVDLKVPDVMVLLQTIDKYSEGFSGKNICVSNTRNGLLLVGLNALSPSLLVSCSCEEITAIMADNLKTFQVCCACIYGSNPPFHPKEFDLYILMPLLNKDNGPDLVELNNACKLSKNVFTLIKADTIVAFTNKYPEAEVCGEIMFYPYESSSNQKAKDKVVTYKVVKLSNIK